MNANAEMRKIYAQAFTAAEANEREDWPTMLHSLAEIQKAVAAVAPSLIALCLRSGMDAARVAELTGLDAAELEAMGE